MASSKKKLTQLELRRLMSEHKKKLQTTVKKIDSPLAKYDKDGVLHCIVCETVVRSENVWTVHLNSKNHKQNLLSRVKKKEQPSPKDDLKPPLPPPPPPASNLKRQAPVATVPVPPKKIKSILKNPIIPKSSIPQEPVENDADPLVDIDAVTSNNAECYSDSDSMNVDSNTESDFINNDTLPEGFFDDPKLDAKARNVEYRDPIEEEWERFQKEIKEETSKAQEIIAEDQEEATTERQIDEIDEQIRNWSRVLNLEKKKEKVNAIPVSQTSDKNEEELTDDEEFEEFLDWRTKKSFDYKLNKLLKTSVIL